MLLTARDEKRGPEAVAKLHEYGLSNVVFHQLDVMDAISIASLAKFIVTNNGKLDILVSNQHLLEDLFTRFPCSEKKGIFGIFTLIQKKKKRVGGGYLGVRVIYLFFKR